MSNLRVVIIALLSAGVFLVPPSIPQAGPPAPRCDGENACKDNTGPIKAFSCIGEPPTPADKGVCEM